MKNKILIKLIVPEIDESYDVYIPINKKVGNVIVLLIKAISDMTNGVYRGTTKTCLYNKMTGEKYSINTLIRQTDIRNGVTIILI